MDDITNDDKYSAKNSLALLELLGFAIPKELREDYIKNYYEFKNLNDNLNKFANPPRASVLEPWASFLLYTVEMHAQIMPEKAFNKRNSIILEPVTNAIHEKGIDKMLSEGMSVEDITNQLYKK